MLQQKLELPFCMGGFFEAHRGRFDDSRFFFNALRINAILESARAFQSSEESRSAPVASALH
tara:strand:- start:368 stop:553 length:186 start_codon:yes stop_codon:yes gene_type:complete